MEDVVIIPNGLNTGDNQVGIVLSHNEEQFHCGLSFDLKKGFKVLHLAWHYDLQYTENTEMFTHWIKPKIHTKRQLMVSVKCKQIQKRIKEMQVPYALLYDKTTFDKDGILLLGEKEHGLTCATFVLAVFKSCGINLVDTENWPEREEDKVWHEQIISYLKQTWKASKFHVENVTNERGCARFRPEEVGISSTFSPNPGPTGEIIHKGRILHDYVMQHS